MADLRRALNTDVSEFLQFASTDERGYCKYCWNLIGTPSSPWHDHQPECPSQEVASLIDRDHHG